MGGDGAYKCSTARAPLRSAAHTRLHYVSRLGPECVWHSVKNPKIPRMLPDERCSSGPHPRTGFLRVCRIHDDDVCEQEARAARRCF